MIRFVDLGTQLGLDETWPRGFAFFNTVTDRFCNFSGTEEWICWKDFEDDYDEHDIERFEGLCPKWVLSAKSWYDMRS